MNPDIAIDNLELTRRIEHKAFQFTFYLSISAPFLWIIWLVFDYYMAKEIFFELLSIRIILSAKAGVIAILMYKKRINAKTAQHLLYLPALTFLGFLFNYCPDHLLFNYIISGVFMVIVSGFVFFIMPIKRAIFFGLYSFLIIWIFQVIFQNHTILELLLNGGILYISMTAFIVAYSSVRFSAINNSIKNDILIELSNKKLREQQEILKNKNTELNESLEEKRLLLREIHHRVKNNLQIISSLLNLQHLKTDALIHDILVSSQNRIHAMALLHEILYKSSDIENINLPEYISLLTKHLFESISAPNRNIDLRLDIVDIPLNIDKLIPLGLILNELITNCIKHAFKGKDGEISIEITLEGNFVHLKISDDGIGLPKNFNSRKKTQLGMRLVQGLVNQLDGSMTIDNNVEGTCTRIVFKMEK